MTPPPEGADETEPTGSRNVGRRAFVTGALVAGTAATTVAVTRLPAFSGPRMLPQTSRSEALVLAGDGVDPTGMSDSTQALQQLVDAAPEGADLWLPAGLYLVDGLRLRRAQSLSGPSARVYTGSADWGARLRGRGTDATVAVLSVGEQGRVCDIAVEGNGRRRPAIRPAGLGVVLERVVMHDASVGFDASYVSGSLLTDCQIHENDIGVQNLVDSVVQSSVINANGSDGIRLGAGANDNEIVATKIEWNDGYGIQAFQALHNVVLGGISDRNGKAGIRLVECSHTVIVGGVYRRNGRLSEHQPDDDCHIYQQDCTGLVVTGIATNVGRDDDDVSGYRSPAVAVRDRGGTGITFAANDLMGRASGAAIAGDEQGTGRVRLLNAGVSGIQRASGTQVRVGTTDVQLPARGTGQALFSLDPVPQGDPGRLYRLVVVALRGTGTRSAAEFPLLIARDRGDATVTLGAVSGQIGEDLGAGGRFQLAATVTADGAALTVTIRNADDSPAQLRVELC
jgi:hypothetical protein